MAIGLLEISFIILLVGMLGLAGAIGAIIMVRIVEPRGTKAFLKRIRARR